MGRLARSSFLGAKWRSLRVLARNVRTVATRDGVGVLAQLRCYGLMRHATAASPLEFYRYRLWDPAVPLADRLAFLNWEIRKPLEGFMNVKTAMEPLRSKIDADALFADLGILTPPRLGVWCPPAHARQVADGLHDAGRLEALLAAHADGLVFKREFGEGGEFVQVFHEATREGLRHVSGEWWPISRLLRTLSDGQRWLIQARVHSHPEVRALTGTDQLAGLRLVTCRRASGRIFLAQAMLKLPSTNTGLDNFSAGNLGVAVDDSGVLGAAVSGLDGPSVDRHPLSGIVLAGVRTPLWREALEVVLDGHARLPPEMGSLGWDAALTGDGPVILEANPHWADATQQPGLRGLLQGEFLEYCVERGAADVLRLERRRAAARGPA